jgi:hypothetical protein
MSLNLLGLDIQKPWLNARVQDLTVDGNFIGNVAINNLESTGNNGFIYDDSVNVIRKDIELPDLQQIGIGAPNNTFLRHDAGTVSFVPIPSDVSIYTADGVLTGNRVVDGGNNQLTIDQVSDFSVNVVNEVGITVGGDINFESSTIVTIDGPQVIFQSSDISVNGSLPVGVNTNELLTLDPSGRFETLPVSSLPATPTIYTADGTLTGDRALNGGGYDLNFNNLGDFNISSTDDIQINASDNLQIVASEITITGNSTDNFTLSGFNDTTITTPTLNIDTADIEFLQTLPVGDTSNLLLTQDSSTAKIETLAISDLPSQQFTENLVTTKNDGYFVSVAKRCRASGPADLGTAFTDITSDLNADDGVVVSPYGGLTPNWCFLIGSTVAPFDAINIQLTQSINLGPTGAILLEYYSASTSQFEPFRLFSAESEPPYGGKADNLFQIGTFNYRTNIDKSDMGLVAIGITPVTAYYWRFRITSAISGVPVADFVKMYPDTMAIKFNDDGFVEYFYADRKFNTTLPTTLLQSGTARVSQDIFLSTDFEINGVQNRFDNSINRSGVIPVTLPANCDTSKPFKIVVKFVTETSFTGNPVFEYQAAYVQKNSKVYLTSGAAPATPDKELTIISSNTDSIGLNDEENVKVSSCLIDVSPCRARRITSGIQAADLMYVRITRLGNTDGFPGDLTVLDISAEYIGWY